MSHCLAVLGLLVGLAGGDLQVGAADPARQLVERVDRRVNEWQTTAEERRFDEIGWADDIREAIRLGKENRRPIFLFTHDGHMNVGRC